MTEMKIEDLPEKYHPRVEAAIKELHAVLAAAYEEQPELVNDFTAVDFTRKQRWALHVLACSFSDFTFWIERKDGRYRATEVESGVAGAPADNAREAMENYWERRYD